jgi:hypothetical protein
MMSLFARHYREKKITQADLKIISNGFLAHLRQHYQTIPIQRQVVRTARRLVFAYSLRSLDAIQLASSVVARLILKAPLTFISADQKLLDIAQLEGFTIENPQHYP